MNYEIDKMKTQLDLLGKKYDDVVKQCIDYETGTELPLGIKMVVYAKIYKSIEKADCMTSCLHNLQELYKDKQLEFFEKTIDIFKDKVIKFMEHEDYKPDVDTWEYVKYDVLNDMIFGYIMETMLKSV